MAKRIIKKIAAALLCAGVLLSSPTAAVAQTSAPSSGAAAVYASASGYNEKVDVRMGKSEKSEVTISLKSSLQAMPPNHARCLMIKVM